METIEKLQQLSVGAHLKLKLRAPLMPQGISQFLGVDRADGMFEIGGYTFAVPLDDIEGFESVDSSLIDPTVQGLIANYVQNWIASNPVRLAA